MFERMAMGWSLVRQSFQVLREDKKLVLFPVFSGIALLLVAASFLVPLFVFGQGDLLNEDNLRGNNPLNPMNPLQDPAVVAAGGGGGGGGVDLTNACVGSAPSNSTGSTVSSGQYFFIPAANPDATASSVALWLFCVIATDPLVMPCFFSSSHIPFAVASGYLLVSAAICTALSA